MTISELHKLFQQYPLIITDTRKLAPASLFFALRGDNFDGNKYAEQALTGGCVYAIIDNKAYQHLPNTILVADVLATLQQLAKYHREQFEIPIIAITGTNGKTTTKELCAAVLSTQNKVTFTQGNLNNHIGVPLTLLSITSDTEIAIIEMGANHLREIGELCEIACPNYGIITNVGKAHLEGFGSFEGIKVTKAELYKWLAKTNGLTFINADNPHLNEMIGQQNTYTYGQSSVVKLQGKLQQGNIFMSMKLHIDKASEKARWINVDTQLLGDYNLENALAAATIGQYFNIQPENIKQALEQYSPKNNRSQLVKTSTNTVLLDAYNANPTSMRLAIVNFANLLNPNKVLVLGDMFELGEYSRLEHQGIVDCIRELDFTEVYLIGEEFSAIKHPYKTCKSTNELKAIWADNTLLDKYVLIKGSRGMGLEVLLDVL